MNTNLNTIYYADAYYRLSQEDGDKTESDSIVNQKALVKEFLSTHPDIQIYKEKVDDGYTGVNFDRPGFQSMLEDIKSGKVNCVIVKDLSRFGRNYIEAGRYIEKIFPYLGVRFISINDHIDTAVKMNVTDEMLIPFKNLINDAYCHDISIKIRSHLDIKRKNGQYIGATAPYGYKKSPENKNQLIIDEEAAQVVRQIFQWKLEGMSASRIADKLSRLGVPTPLQHKKMYNPKYHCGYQKKTENQWEVNTVNNILKNEVYTGTLVQGKTYSLNYKVRKRIDRDESEWIRCENCHEPIISKGDFDLVRDDLKIDTRVSPYQEKLYVFSGFIKCGTCGGTMTRKTVTVNGKKYVYLTCVENKKGHGCKNNKMISLKKFENVILKTLNTHIENIVELSSMLSLKSKIPYEKYVMKHLQEGIAAKKSEIEKKQEYGVIVYEDYIQGVVSKEEYLEFKEAFRKRTEELEKEIQELQSELEKRASEQKSSLEWMERFIECRGFTELSRKLLLMMIEEIRIYGKDRVEVIFKFQSEYEDLYRYFEATCENEVIENGEKKQEEV